MREATDNDAFILLFEEAYKKCFGLRLSLPMGETAAKHFSNSILEATGLVIGAKSLKNYAGYVLNPQEAKPEKPSTASLDTLARYVLDAPYSNELERKNKEAHFPYWFRWLGQANTLLLPATDQPVTAPKKKKKKLVWLLIPLLLLAGWLLFFLHPVANESFTEDFHAVAEDTLRDHGWFVMGKDPVWWAKRGELPAHLSLYALHGDNWADSANAPGIRNLLVRKTGGECYTAEILLDNFIPQQEWQQAGIVFLEDTSYRKKSLRISIAFNDFFGGFSRPKEIILQAIVANGNNPHNPEEIIHLPLFSIAAGTDSIVAGNLKKSALRIEKTRHHFRILYATGTAGNIAFKEAFSRDLEIDPIYVGIFALQGFVPFTNYAAARVSFFSLTSTPCSR